MNTSAQIASAATNVPEATGLTGLAMAYVRLEDAAAARFEAAMLEPDDGSEHDAQHRAIVADQRVLVSLMAAVPSHTPFDLQAKARVLDTLIPAPLTPHGDGGIPHGHLIRSLINDILITRVQRDPDAELLHLGRQLAETHAVEMAAWKLADEEPEDGPLTAEARRLCATSGGICRRIQAITATTLAGLLVKAHAIGAIRGGEDMTFDAILGREPQATDERLLAGLLVDLLAMAAIGPS